MNLVVGFIFGRVSWIASFVAMKLIDSVPALSQFGETGTLSLAGGLFGAAFTILFYMIFFAVVFGVIITSILAGMYNAVAGALGGIRLEMRNPDAIPAGPGNPMYADNPTATASAGTTLAPTSREGNPDV